MESCRGHFLVLITLVIIHIVQPQDQKGFISLDCGLPEDEQSPYRDNNSGLLFSSDEKFIQSGKIGRIGANLGNFVKQYQMLRYFPDGIRNCYNLSVEKGRKYLIRASFMYGNYDGRSSAPVFDLHLGPNLWAKLDLGILDAMLREIIHIPTSDLLQICLVKNGTTTPLISSLELRPLADDIYITESGSLDVFLRRYFSNSRSHLRYKKDVYDRIWEPFFMKDWTQISTAVEVGNNKYAVPEDALRSAAMPTNTSAPLAITWSPINPNDQYFLYSHFSEIQEFQANETREFSLVLNGQLYHGPLVPALITIYSKTSSPCKEGECTLQLIRTNRSTLPPILSAFEVYTIIQFPQSETDESDVGAIKNITAAYALSRNRINWQGDPCVPQQLRWDGLNCNNTDMSVPPRITTLNLSSSRLNGTIAAAIESLTKLQKLDLSNNNLTGGVPEFLGHMKSLLVINLTGNNLDGSIPQALKKEGLELLVDGNPRLCVTDSCPKKHKNKALVPVVTSVSFAALVIVVAVLLFLFKKKKSTITQGLHSPPMASTMNITFANKKSKRFTYSDVIKMTNNFQRVLGKGGFGMVYHGTINGSEQVAVKVLSQSSTQGDKQFKAEVDLLLRVHHTNLVSLVGYCYEGNHLALIYEFMPNGDLKQHLSGKGGRSIIDWSTRLQVALEAAQGLEYLHIGCTPPIVHRDVKTANILLDENFKAKLGDFGLSRTFQGGAGSQDTTAIAGTLGYLDPEYNNSGRLAEKSDVYSFGIVLLEIITNQPVIHRTHENSHITQWVGFKLNGGDITEIMDPNLHKEYDSNSAWRALELAMSCANPSSSKRPSMSQVIYELKECIACETQGLEYQEMNISVDTMVVPTAR